MFTPLKSSSPVLVMISSMSVPICNHSHARRANSGKIKLLEGTPFYAFVRGKPFYPGPRNFVTKNSILVTVYSKDLVILLCIVLIQSQRVTNEQTDRQMARRWLKCAKHYVLSNAKTFSLSSCCESGQPPASRLACQLLGALA